MTYLGSTFNSPPRIRTIRISMSEEMVTFDVPPLHVQSVPSESSKIFIRGSEFQNSIPVRRLMRLVSIHLNFIKNKNELAACLAARDLQKVEKCKSMQRSYISRFRQRQNGKFAVEKGTPSKIRAPYSLKNESPHM